MMIVGFLEIGIGDRADFEEQTARYDRTAELLSRHAVAYGLPAEVSEVAESEELMEVLRSCVSPEAGAALRFRPPPPVLRGVLKVELFESAGLRKTRENFAEILRGSRGKCRNAPQRDLCYRGCRFHRIARDFIAQCGDVTRNDGSGGESIYGGGKPFADDKEGLKLEFEYGSLGMANSGKNSNTSQFFLVLARDKARLAKLSGRYVCFGRVLEESRGLLDELNNAAGENEVPKVEVWVESCGIL